MAPMVAAPLSVEWSLLGFLHDHPMHGYEIHQTLATSEGLGLVWRLKQSQLYALLGKLEERGYIRYTLESQPPRPPRKVYQLTETGRAALATWVRTPVEHGRELRLEFLAKLYFARQEGEVVVQTLLQRQQKMCAVWLKVLREEAQALEKTRPYDQLVYEFRIGQVQAMLDWLETCADMLIT